MIIKMAKKKKIDTSDMSLGVFKTGFPMVDLFTGRDHIEDINKPDQYYKIRGIRSGTMISFFAESTLGKTTLSLNIAGNIARRNFYKKPNKSMAEIHYYAAEGGADLARICATTGIPHNEKVSNHIELYKRKDVSTDKMFDEFKEVCEMKKKNEEWYTADVKLANNKKAKRFLPTIFIIDSISALTPEQLKEKDEVDNMHAATRARINGNYLEKMRDLAAEYNIMIFMIQHETAKIDTSFYSARKRRGYGSSVAATGGSKAEFESDLQIRIDRIIAHDKKKTNKKYKNDEGFTSIVRGVITKNRYGDANPDMNFHLVQHRLYGFDPLHSYIYDLLDKTDIISHSGAGRYEVEGYDSSFYVREIADLIKSESKFRKLLKKEINEKYHDMLSYHDTDELLNEQQNIIEDLL
jgi:RecA/RadA recombinase